MNILRKLLRRGEGDVDGFTLLELLIVIGIIVILAAIVFVALDPAKRFAQARNAQRWSSVNSVLNAVLQYNVDNKGAFPTQIDSTPGSVQLVGSGAAIDCTTLTATTYCPGQTIPIGSATACFSDLAGPLVTAAPGYLGQLPADPQNGTAADTRFWLNKTANNRIEVGACDGEGETIKVTR